jgi:hypothetical protein
LAASARRWRRELHPEDRRAGEHRTLGRAQPLQAGGEQGLDRRWQRRQALAAALLADRGDQLLQEQRVAAGRREQLSTPPRRRRRSRQRAEQRIRVVVSERSELHGDGPRRTGRPGRALLQQLRARQAQQQYRRRLYLGHQRLDQVEEGRLRPLQVIEDDQERFPPRQRLHQPTRRPEDLHGRPDALPARADGPRQALAHPLGVRLARQ